MPRAFTVILPAIAGALAAEPIDQLLEVIAIPAEAARVRRAILMASTTALASLPAKQRPGSPQWLR